MNARNNSFAKMTLTQQNQLCHFDFFDIIILWPLGILD